VSQTDTRQEQPIKGLFSQLAADAKQLVQAEVEVYKATAADKAAVAAPAVAALVVALLLVQAGLVTLFLMIALVLATQVGPVAAGVILLIVALAIAGVLALWAKSRLALIRTDPETGR